ncbi:MAG: hypothetical protein R8G66_19910 [Cytophagales bacterium]|nr:hypothetical protein [Cytophagales bacterium]
MNDEIKYESKFSVLTLAITSLGMLFFAITGSTLLRTLLLTREISFLLLLPICLISLGVLSGYLLLNLKKVVITKEHLILEYLFINKTIEIKWEAIHYARRKHAIMNINVESGDSIKGSAIKVFSKAGNYNISSFTYVNFSTILNQFESRIDPKIRRQLRKEFKEQLNLFKDSEERYKTIRYKYVIPICLIILILIWIWKNLQNI